jgi:hypothetical protein
MTALPLIGAGLLTAMIVLERPYPVGALAEHRSPPARGRTPRQQSGAKRRRHA